MRFWSVTLLVATLLLLLYAATYFIVSHTVEQTTETLIKTSPEQENPEENPERFEGVTSEDVVRESLRRAGANESLADVAPHKGPAASASGE